MDAYGAQQWVIDPIEKITDDGWSVVSSVRALNILNSCKEASIVLQGDLRC